MKDIKFRAWDKNKKEMTLNDSFYELQKWNRTEEELKSFELMQYTGLKDKNGEDIYEDDIVDCRGDGIEGLYKIEFQPGRFIMRGVELSIVIWDVDYHVNVIRVIGNIHENSELTNRNIKICSKT